MKNISTKETLNRKCFKEKRKNKKSIPLTYLQRVPLMGSLGALDPAACFQVFLKKKG